MADVLPGTLDLLILQAVALGSGVLLRIQQISAETSENNRRAKFYSLTPSGKRQLQTETQRWNLCALARPNMRNAAPGNL
jgi:hypothetical protein